MKIRKFHTYGFVGQDPIVSDLHRLRGNSLTDAQVSKTSGVSASTLSNWWTRRTKRPQFATVMAVARAMGGDLVLHERKPASSKGRRK